MNPHFGLGLLDSYPSFTVFMPYFIRLNLPYSVKRGETLVLEIMLYNYLTESLQAQTDFHKNDAEFAVVQSNGWTTNNGTFNRYSTINSDGVAVITISIVPKVLGFITLKVSRSHI
jgi:hypothetical protein